MNYPANENGLRRDVPTLRWISARPRTDDGLSEAGDASGNEGQAAVAHCEAVRRNICMLPVVPPALSASVRARGILDSGIAQRSSRADIASFLLPLRKTEW